MSASAVACLLAAAAAAVLLTPADAAALRRLGPPASGRTDAAAGRPVSPEPPGADAVVGHEAAPAVGPRRPGLSSTVPGLPPVSAVPRAVRLGGAVVGAVLVALLAQRYGPVAVTGAVAVVAAAVVAPRWRRAREERRRCEQRRAAVTEACDVVAAELRAGRTPHRALEVAAEQLPALRPVAAAARMQAEVPTALRRARGPGTEAFGPWAAAWQVAESSGAALADVLDLLAQGLRDDLALRREVGAQLAGPRATARLLCLLPAFGLFLGAGIGGNPVAILTGTPYGLACLVVGVALVATGLWWVERLARRAEQR